MYFVREGLFNSQTKKIIPMDWNSSIPEFHLALTFRFIILVKCSSCGKSGMQRGKEVPPTSGTRLPGSCTHKPKSILKLPLIGHRWRCLAVTVIKHFSEHVAVAQCGHVATPRSCLQVGGLVCAEEPSTEVVRLCSDGRVRRSPVRDCGWKHP